MTDSFNVELARSIYADWECRDWSSSVWANDEIEFVTTEGPWAGSVIGKPAMTRTLARVVGGAGGCSRDADAFYELGDGRVVALHTWSARGKASGLAVERMEAKSAVLFEVVGG